MAKNKVKTRSAAKKRFAKVGNGKIKRSKAFRRHLLSKKTRKRKRNLRQVAYLEGADRRAVSKLIPYQ
jgi:large subunit ribosomal protein L35